MSSSSAKRRKSGMDVDADDKEAKPYSKVGCVCGELSLHLCRCLSVSPCLFVSLCLFLSLSLFVSLFVSLSVSVCLFVSLSLTHTHTYTHSGLHGAARAAAACRAHQRPRCGHWHLREARPRLVEAAQAAESGGWAVLCIDSLCPSISFSVSLCLSLFLSLTL